jgi:hypothetical protein
MKIKLIAVSILAVFLLITISIVSAVSSETTDEDKESPLYKIRTKLAIGERVQNLITELSGERVFFLPFQQPFRDEGFSAREYFLKEDFKHIYWSALKKPLCVRPTSEPYLRTCMETFCDCRTIFRHTCVGNTCSPVTCGRIC